MKARNLALPRRHCYPLKLSSMSADELSGHQGHLSPDQQHAFAAFKQIAQAAGLYTPAERGSAFASHDEPTLL